MKTLDTLSHDVTGIFTHLSNTRWRKSWEETINSGITRLIYDGGFVDESTGFLSFGTINTEAPDLYVTLDGGHTWNEAILETGTSREEQGKSRR